MRYKLNCRICTHSLTETEHENYKINSFFISVFKNDGKKYWLASRLCCGGHYWSVCGHYCVDGHGGHQVTYMPNITIGSNLSQWR